MDSSRARQSQLPWYAHQSGTLHRRSPHEQQRNRRRGPGQERLQLAVSNGAGRTTEQRRFSRTQFERFWVHRLPCRVVMEACASAHFWARRLSGLGFGVVLLPPYYVRPYVRSNKTDRTDCEALLEAQRCSGIHPVSVKSEDQQAVAALHRVRSQWMSTRTARINGARALIGETATSTTQLDEP